MSNPSSGPGATPNPDSQPATGTATAGATPGQPTVTLEAALAQIEELKHAHDNATGELKRHREKLSAFEKAEEDKRIAALSDVEKATKRAETAEAQIAQYRQQLASAHVKLAAQAMGIVDPDIAALAIQSQLEFDEHGLPTNVDKLLKELLKSKPYLGKPADTSVPPATSAQTAQTAQTPPQIPAMNPGRASITRPGSPTPGTIPNFADIYRQNRQK